MYIQTMSALTYSPSLPIIVHIDYFTVCKKRFMQADKNKKGVAEATPFFVYKLALILHLSVACAAVYRSIIGRLEGNLRNATAFCTSSLVHLALGLTACLSLVTAALASLGLVLEASFSIEFLFACGEYEFSAAIFAN